MHDTVIVSKPVRGGGAAASELADLRRVPMTRQQTAHFRIIADENFFLIGTGLLQVTVRPILVARRVAALPPTKPSC